MRKASRQHDKAVVLWLLGGCCRYCGEADPDVMQVDHIFGARESHAANGRSGASLYGAIVRGARGIEDLALACANCNQRKRLKRGEHRGYKQRSRYHQ